MSYERFQQGNEAQRNIRGDVQSSQARERTRQNEQDANHGLNTLTQPFLRYPDYSTGQSGYTPFRLLHDTAGGYVQSQTARPQSTRSALHEARSNIGRQVNDNGQLQGARVATSHGLPAVGMGWSRSLRKFETPVPSEWQRRQRSQEAADREHKISTERQDLERQQERRMRTANQQPQPLESGPQADSDATRIRDSVIGLAPRVSNKVEQDEQPSKLSIPWIESIYEAISESPEEALTRRQIRSVVQSKHPHSLSEANKESWRQSINHSLDSSLKRHKPAFRRVRKVGKVWLFGIARGPAAVQTPPHRNPSQDGRSNGTTVDDSDSDANWDTADGDSDTDEISGPMWAMGGTPETQATTRESSMVLSDQESGAEARVRRAKKRTSSPFANFEEFPGRWQRAKERESIEAIERQEKQTKYAAAQERNRTKTLEWKNMHKDKGTEARRKREERKQEQELLFKQHSNNDEAA